MTEQQFEKLTRNKYLYDYYMRVGTINSFELSEISEVHNEVYGKPIDLSCGSCIDSGLKTLYSMYLNQLNQK